MGIIFPDQNSRVSPPWPKKNFSPNSAYNPKVAFFLIVFHFPDPFADLVGNRKFLLGSPRMEKKISAGSDPLMAENYFLLNAGR